LNEDQPILSLCRRRTTTCSNFSYSKSCKRRCRRAGQNVEAEGSDTEESATEQAPDTDDEKEPAPETDVEEEADTDDEEGDEKDEKDEKEEAPDTEESAQETDEGDKKKPAPDTEESGAETDEGDVELDDQENGTDLDKLLGSLDNGGGGGGEPEESEEEAKQEEPEPVPVHVPSARPKQRASRPQEPRAEPQEAEASPDDSTELDRLFSAPVVKAPPKELPAAAAAYVPSARPKQRAKAPEASPRAQELEQAFEEAPPARGRRPPRFEFSDEPPAAPQGRELSDVEEQRKREE